jgi:pyruvate kinase
VGLDYKELPRDVAPGAVLLLDDGLIRLRVESVRGSEIVTRVEVGGVLSNNKGINRQGGGLTAPALTAKDMEDMKTAVAIDADYLAVSFPKNKEDMYMARQLLRAAGGKALLIAKIERAEAITALEEIIDASDGIMVARGDLAVEVGNATIPGLQKRMIRLARERNKLTITATQMMESMIVNPVPTRAEVSDVANAVLDGTDAVMLSGETSVGKYPILTVSTMAKIISTTEGGDFGVPRLQHDPRTHGGALTVAASQIARNIGAKALVAFSQTGDTVRRLSRLHCELPLYAFTPVAEVRDQLAVSWGVETFLTDFVQHTDDMFRQVDGKMLGLGLAKPGDYVVVVAGSPPNAPGATNTLRVHQLGTLVDPSTV